MAARKLLTFFALAFIAFPQMSFASHGMLPTRFAGDYVRVVPTGVDTDMLMSGPAVKTQLLYYGGPVISNVKVYLVLWGKNVDSSITAGLPGFFSAITQSSYMDWINEYNTGIKAVDGRQGTNQALGRGSYVSQITINPSKTSSSLTDDDIQAELQAQIDAGVLPKPDDNTLYMTYFPPGVSITAFGASSCAQFCAYHGFKGDPSTAHFYYGVMPDIGGACASGCGFAMDQFASMTAISSHEYMESITDPYPTPGSTPAFPQAWNTSDGNEIGDLCVGTLNTLKTANGSYTVQGEFDNASAGCTNKTWAAP